MFLIFLTSENHCLKIQQISLRNLRTFDNLSRRFWYLPEKLPKFREVSSTSANFGQKSENLRITLQTCENGWRNLADILNSDSKGANVYKSCRSRQELSREYLIFTCNIWLRYTWEWASQSLPKISQKLEKKLEKSY